jgi:hypothetical protein
MRRVKRAPVSRVLAALGGALAILALMAGPSLARPGLYSGSGSRIYEPRDTWSNSVSSMSLTAADSAGSDALGRAELEPADTTDTTDSTGDSTGDQQGDAEGTKANDQAKQPKADQNDDAQGDENDQGDDQGDDSGEQQSAGDHQGGDSGGDSGGGSGGDNQDSGNGGSEQEGGD